MRRPWFAAQPIEDSFFDTAPFRIADSFDVALPAERVWGDLTGDDPLAWCRIIQRIDWTSRRPFGVGTTRTARALGGMSVLRERFFRWEDGRRMSFFVLEASLPLFRRFGEDYLVEPVSQDACRFTWTIAAEPRPAARIGDRGNRLLLGTLFRDTRRHYGVG